VIEHERTTEQARLLDGTWVSPQEALKTMVGIYQALSSGRIPNRLGMVLQMRLRIDELDEYVKDCSHPDDPEGEFAMRRVNETLMSPIFDLDAMHEQWTVPERTALAILRTMVVVDTDQDSDELHIQEPFADRPMLQQAWLEYTDPKE
jgi:hypothetical protein